MGFDQLLNSKKKAIIEKWFDATIENYHKDTVDFLKSHKDRFTNPVGSITYKGLENLFDEILNYSDKDKIAKHLDAIIRIRAVQDFLPSDALSFISRLKIIVREELAEEITKGNLNDDLERFDYKIDNLILMAFDIFMKCREKIYDLKANELRNMTLKLIERANRIFELKYKKSNNSLNDLLERGEI
jgi:hypothetical protein